MDGFTLDVGYIDNPGSTEVEAFGASGTLLGTVPTDQVGINRLTIPFSGVASFIVKAIAPEGNGFAIDNVSFVPGGFTITGSHPVQIPNADTDGPTLLGSLGCNPYLLESFDGLGLGAVAYIKKESGPTGATLLANFLAGAVNHGAPRDLSSTNLAKDLVSSSEFKKLDKQVQADVGTQLRGGTTTVTVNKSALTPPDFADRRTEPDLYWSFRGTQGVDVNGSGGRVGDKFIGTITYTIRDTYGFNVSEDFHGVAYMMHYLQTTCGWPYTLLGAHWFPDFVTVTVPFSQPA